MPFRITLLSSQYGDYAPAAEVEAFAALAWQIAQVVDTS